MATTVRVVLMKSHPFHDDDDDDDAEEEEEEHVVHGIGAGGAERKCPLPPARSSRRAILR